MYVQGGSFYQPAWGCCCGGGGGARGSGREYILWCGARSARAGTDADARRNSLLGVGIFGESTTPGFLSLNLQSQATERRQGEKSRPCLMNSPNRIAWFISSSVLRCLWSESTHRVSINQSPRRQPNTHFRITFASGLGNHTCMISRESFILSLPSLQGRLYSRRVRIISAQPLEFLIQSDDPQPSRRGGHRAAPQSGRGKKGWSRLRSD